jgi:hypothetical protein
VFESGFQEDDVQYVIDLGLIRRDQAGGMQLANRIYQEVIPRALAWEPQTGITQEPAWYIRSDGRLDVPSLLAAFQDFFREHSEHWLERFDYREAGPQLLLQAFLQRIVNGGGRIEREYGLGRRRTDLLVIWPYSEQLSPTSGIQRVVLELKIVHGGLETTIAEGLEQTRAYMDRCAADELEGHLILFDRDPAKPWADKIFRREATCRGTPITVWGM